MSPSKNRLTELCSSRASDLLSVYYTAGFPALDDTVRIAKALAKAGTDIIELGVPFSDPVADGPTIQSSNKAALDNGMSLRLLLEQTRELRRSIETPIVLMGYLNPVLQYGVEAFCADAAAAGVDGVILPDLPMDEYLSEHRSVFEAHRLSNIFLVAPTTPDHRIRAIDEVTDAFIYAVSASSITGARGQLSDAQKAYFERLRGLRLRNPYLIGFGISNRATFSTACSYGAGAIVGSAFIDLVRASTHLEQDIHSFVRQLRGAER